MRAKPSKIPYPNIRELFEHNKLRSKRINSFIYQINTTTRNIYYLEEGAVRLFNYQNGEKKTRQIIFKNNLFGVEGYFGEKYYQYYAESLTKAAHYRTLPISDFELKLKNNYRICLDFCNYLEAQKKVWQNRFLIKSSYKRKILIIQYIEALATKIGVRVGVEILIPITPTHQDIASILGISRQTVSQTLKKLANENLIYYDRKRIIIRNSDGKINY